jgi:Spy/CpxP family protein refolding chaperone
MKSKTSAALLLVAIFLLGGVAGGVSHYLYQNHFVAAQPPRPRVPISHDIVEDMAQHLKLDAQQKEQLKVIIKGSREHYDTLSRQFQPQYEKIRSETNDAIREILRPDQQKQFQETLEKMDSRRRDRGRDNSPNPPGPSK